MTEVKLEDGTIMTVKPLGPDDNDGMLEVLRRSPIRGNISVLFDRRPDIFLMPNIRYDSFQYQGFFLDDRLVGFGMMGHESTRVGGNVEKTFHLSNFYLVEEARGKGITRSVPPMFRRLMVRPEEVGYAVIMKGNLPAETIAFQRGDKDRERPFVKKIGYLEVHNILPLFRKKVKGRVRRAEKDDIPAMIDLLKDEHRSRIFSPIFDVKNFDSWIERRTGLSLKDHYIAERNGDTVGVAAAWDTGGFKQNIVISYGKKMRIQRSIHTLVSKLMGTPHLPSPMNELKTIHIPYWCVRNRDPAILRELLGAICNQYRKTHHCVSVASYSGDSILDATKGFRVQKLVSNIILIGYDEKKFEDRCGDTSRPYIDIATL